MEILICLTLEVMCDSILRKGKKIKKDIKKNGFSGLVYYKRILKKKKHT